MTARDASPAVSRRVLLGGAAAAAAAGAIPRPAQAKTGATARRADVIVVGAGLAGLAAARRLVARGRSAFVLEARGRVGGRTWRQDIGGGTSIDLGGQYIGPTQSRLKAMAKATGVKTYDVYHEGEELLGYNGAVTRFTGVVPPVGDPDQVEATLTLVALSESAKAVPLDTPWTADGAAALDAQTLEQWIVENVETEGARWYLRAAARVGGACEPADTSVLNQLWSLHASPQDEDPEMSRFVGTAQPISDGLARQLGSRVVLRAPVHRIEQRGRQAIVTSDAGRFAGRHVIVALPPALAGRIEYVPGVSALRDQLTQRMPMGSVIKVHAVYPTPFWRSQGLNGGTWGDGILTHTTDSSPPDGRPGIIVGFIAGAAARLWAGRSAARRRDAVISDLVRYFGAPAGRPQRYVDTVWPAQTWSRGCYGGQMTPGGWMDFGTALRAPVGRLHWAGTETALKWPGYMDGAVSSGERAADEVLVG